MDGHINDRNLRLPHRHMGTVRILTGQIWLPEVGPAQFDGVHGGYVWDGGWQWWLYSVVVFVAVSGDE